MADPSTHDQLISEFAELTGASPADAQQYLATNRWDLPNAVTEYFTAQEEAVEQGGDDHQEAEPYTGPRTLDGRPAPEAASAIPVASSSAPSRRIGGIATLGSLASSSQGHGHAGHGHAHDDDDDDDDEDYEPGEEPRDLFAGGEKSGLAVQDPGNRNDPRKVVNDILKKARANAAKIGGEPAAPPPTRFRGSGQTLGGDDTPSQTIPDPTPRDQDPGATQTRILHLWEDGFSIEDGPLRAFSDPQNAADLNMIRQGRAPLHLMGVRHDQPVDVQLIKHDENYKPQPTVYKPFSGSGQRLGSPTPGPSGFADSPSIAAPAPVASSTPTTPEVAIDPAQPTLALRIQLANGTRLPARFNTTQTVGDVYTFIERASSANSGGRSWVLATTFPNKDHTDKSLVLGDMAEFKRGGTAVQKWT
ncbi:UBX domain-containing 1 [Hyphodiscus hymeniophilus]|uniref:UBX domain-containing 1 n=1 Tax=Hyphodiscus hymeniophilus TaxID=353542 RepID=A0A9P7AUH8_9HELO|nr:UBX domain-containing 1 [Hyphodiscus hymeniophilus]